MGQSCTSTPRCSMLLTQRALCEYYEAVAARTREMLMGLKAKDLDAIVDERWDPPVTLGVRLVSVLNDDLQHVGQAAYARGLLAHRKALNP